MDGNSVDKESQAIVIDDDDDVIDLDCTEKTPEDVIYEWDAKIRKKLAMFAVADNENILGDVMKEYLMSLKEMARNYEDNETFKNKVFCHISFLYAYYVELECCTPDNYLSTMEDILTLHCNLELEVIRSLKKKDLLSNNKYKKRLVTVSRKIIHLLTVYLLERHDHILHVLIKMNTNNVSDFCSEVLNILYSHFLTKVPVFNLSDESFCRYYIVFQKWKEIRKIEDWEGMDKIMYKMFKRTPESIKNNETLRQILMPACQSTVGIVLNLFRSFRDISNAYFKHVSAKKSVEIDDIDFNIDLGEDEPTIPVDDENDEEVTFMKAYYEIERNMSNLPHSENSSDIAEVDIVRKYKVEIDEDDDVQFVGITVLPKQPVHNLIDDEENVHGMSNANKKSTSNQNEEERIPVTTPPSLPNPPKEKKEKPHFVENLNGISRIRLRSPHTVTESSGSCPVNDTQPPAKPPDAIVYPQVEEVRNVGELPPEINQPKVSLNNTQVSSPPSPAKISEKRIIEMKSVEVQADSISNCVYNDYGLTTPPFDVPQDEQVSRAVEPRVYTDIGQNEKKRLSPDRESVREKNNVLTRTAEVQVDKHSPYNDYGLTPPNDTLDDRGVRLQKTCLYTNIGQNHKDLSEEKTVEDNESDTLVDVQENPEHEPDNQAVEILTNNESKEEEEVCTSEENIVTEHESDYGDLETHLDISEMTNIDTECDTEEIDVESCHETDKDSTSLNTTQEEIEESHFDVRINPNLQISEYSSFESSDQIDTGQKLILNTAPNIESEPPAVEPETKEPEIFNGSTVLKPILLSNRTNGQSKDTPNPTKIMYTSSQKIRAASLDDFTRFESAINVKWNKMKENHDFEDILSGPVSKVVPTKHNLIGSHDKLDIFGQESIPIKSMANSSSSRSNSPTEMTSPAYEAIDDFRNYFSDSVNGRVPPPHDVKVPQGILKKGNSTRRKNYGITIFEPICDNSEEFEERRHRSDGVLIPKRLRRDQKLNMAPRVVVERLSFIENKIKKALNSTRTLRVDYDKSTTHINEKDVVRCISPPKFSWILNIAPSRTNPGKVKSPVNTCSKKVPSKCEKTQSPCCDQLVEEFTKLNCNIVEDRALNLTVSDVPHVPDIPHVPPVPDIPRVPPVDPETEFSNSPTFLQGTDELVQHCLEETSKEIPDVVKPNSLLCDNSNFYTSQTCVTNDLSSKTVESNELKFDFNLKETIDETLLKLPTAVPESYDFEKNLKNEVFSKIDWQNFDDSDGETRLPLKKRKLSVANKNEDEKKEEISYPATPMISIAEVEALHPRKLQTNNARPFKTPAERKEMPPLPVFYNVESDPSPIITDQFNINNHTYNNPTINYHMNNVPVPFINIPCGSYYSLPPILVPFNNMSNFDQAKVNQQQQETTYLKKENNRKQGRRRRH